MLISQRGQRLLKLIHLLAVSSWLGGGLSLLVLGWISMRAQGDGELFGILRGMKFVIIIVTVYLGAYGSFFTGLAYSLCTNRGFFRHRWIILKWAMTIWMIAFGMALLGPWSTAMLERANLLGLAAYADPEYVDLYFRYMVFVGLQMFMLLLAVIISIYKPWEEGEKKMYRQARADERKRRKAQARAMRKTGDD